MKKIYLTLSLGLCALCGTLHSQNYLVSTPHTSLLLYAKEGKKAYINYYGTKITPAEINSIFNAGLALSSESYPAFGLRCEGEKAISVTQSDGNMSLDLMVESVKQYDTTDGQITEILMKDKVYPFEVKQIFKAYKNCDVIGEWEEITNYGKKPATMYQFASSYLPVKRGDNWLSHLEGVWGAENKLSEEYLTNGEKSIINTDGVRNAQTANPSFMLSMDGKPQEESGNVLGGTLAWSGNYRLKFEVSNQRINILSGIDEDNSHYILDPKKTFTTPEFDMTYSTSGKGGVSRSFHRWARKYKLCHGDQLRNILLNSWEGVYFNVNQKTMAQMMHDIASMGGELFVMDDGWFGNKYPRNNGNTSLGDWSVCKQKLPGGIEGLINSAKENNIKFGIWIEPEMSNTKSELFEKHPDWILSQSNRPITTGRGGTQVVLDLTNPKVQDFVFGIVDNLMTKYPQIAYMKWDANADLMNYGSHYLPKDRQSQIYIDYHKGLINVLKRIRNKYPDLVMQACASGGGRADYGVLPYFDEFWTSDNTDALQRIYIQWGISNFYPAMAMAAHVSETGHYLPLKFRFDVAMTGRLGLEIQPKNMNQKEKAFSTKAISDYKSIRDIVELGDLYRLISPYENKNIASLMYSNPNKTEAVLFAYKLAHMSNQTMPLIKLTGVDETKSYKITELDIENKPCYLNGKVISGKILKEQGLSVPLSGIYGSIVLKLTEVN